MRRSSLSTSPGKPVRVRWRREEEFGFEPVSPAMVVTAQAMLDKSGSPADWTTEIWSGRHTSRPGGGGNLLAAEALPDPPPPPPAVEADRSAGRRHPQRRAALRFRGKADRASPDRRDAGAHLVVARARRHAQRLRDRIVDGRVGRAGGPGPGRLPALGIVRSAGPRGRRACGADEPTGRRACRPAPGAVAASALPATRTWPPMPQSSPRSRSTRVCVSSACGARRMPVS